MGRQGWDSHHRRTCRILNEDRGMTLYSWARPVSPPLSPSCPWKRRVNEHMFWLIIISLPSNKISQGCQLDSMMSGSKDKEQTLAVMGRSLYVLLQEPKAEIIASVMLKQGPRLREHWLPGKSPVSTLPWTGITNVPYILFLSPDGVISFIFFHGRELEWEREQNWRGRGSGSCTDLCLVY